MATLKTAGVKTLVEEVIADLPRSLTEHVTLAVFKENRAQSRPPQRVPRSLQ